MLCICRLLWRATTNRYPSCERGQKEMEIVPLPVFRSDWKNPRPQTPCNYLCLTLIILSCALRQVKAPWVRDILKLQTVSPLWPCPIPLFGRWLPPGALLYTAIGAFGSVQEEYNGREFHLLPNLSCIVCIVHNVSSPCCWHFWLSASFLGSFQCVCVLFCSILWCSWSGYNP